MRLYQLMDIKNKDIISVVGAGGKTSLCQELSKELKAVSKNILLTTTTAIYRPDPPYYSIVDSDLNILIDKLRCQRNETMVAALCPMEQNKLKGIPPEWVDKIQKQEIFDNIIVEADGARGKSLKFYGHHEPQIPLTTNKVIVVIGADCFNKPINSNNVHRHENLIKHFGIDEKIINPELIYNLLKDKAGLTKGIPKTSKRYLAVNKVKSPGELQFFHEVTKSCLRDKIFDGYVALDLNHENPIIKYLRGD
jgi:probable selenium-dependent hydroxylase accessory protein YqeC